MSKKKIAATKKSSRKKTPTKKKSEIEFHYLKTGNYRSYHVDGVIGGITPRGKIYMELFLERAPTPKLTRHEIENSGILGKEVQRESKTGIIREVETGIILDLQTAELISGWLKEKIKTLKSNLPRDKRK